MKKNLSDVIRNAREKQGISQRELSRITNIDHNTIARIENGERKKPNTLSLTTLANVLNLDLYELMEMCGYSKEQIDVLRQKNSSVDYGIKKIEDLKERLKEVQEKIDKINDLIRRLEHSKNTHEDPAYENMSEKDKKFFDKQSDELIEINKEFLKMYKMEEKFIKENLNHTFGLTMKNFGIDVIKIEDIDFDLNED